MASDSVPCGLITARSAKPNWLVVLSNVYDHTSENISDLMILACTLWLYGWVGHIRDTPPWIAVQRFVCAVLREDTSDLSEHHDGLTLGVGSMSMLIVVLSQN